MNQHYIFASKYKPACFIQKCIFEQIENENCREIFISDFSAEQKKIIKAGKSLNIVEESVHLWH